MTHPKDYLNHHSFILIQGNCLFSCSEKLESTVNHNNLKTINFSLVKSINSSVVWATRAY